MKDTWNPINGSLDLSTLKAIYTDGTIGPVDVISAVIERIRRRGNDHVWISRIDESILLARARKLEELLHDDRSILDRMPLFGIPFGVKDNIDVLGLETTAACPGFAYQPEVTATTVTRLLDAGAILIGKTNMDQFATGLVGTRSGYGTPVSPFGEDRIPGGSSSGSAVAVAAGLVSFALGTDTAGSGRVPAGLNNIIGLKPTRGMFSSRGMVPACRSLDCISVFSLCCDDAATVADIMAQHDDEDAFSRPEAQQFRYQLYSITQPKVLAVPAPDDLQFFGDKTCRTAFLGLIDELDTDTDFRVVEIDFSLFRQAAKLLYDGPWITERKIAFGEFINSHRDRINPSVFRAVSDSAPLDAEDSFNGYYQLRELHTQVAKMFKGFDAMIVPTYGRSYRISDIIDDDYVANRQLGYYTNFVNLLDLSAVSAPSAMLTTGLPFGFTLIGPAFSDSMLLSIADQIHRSKSHTIGGTGQPLPAQAPLPAEGMTDAIDLCVVGAHMRGLPLNQQLIKCQASFIRQTYTAAHYKLFCLQQLEPIRPGLVRYDEALAIEVEVWRIPLSQFGRFMMLIDTPLAIGTVELEDGTWVKGFVCEDYAIQNAPDISHFGGWRSYLADT